MKIRRRRKFNMKNCYIIFVTAFALLSFGANVFQNYFYNQALEIQKDTISELASHNTYSVMDNR